MTPFQSRGQRGVFVIQAGSVEKLLMTPELPQTPNFITGRFG